MYRLKNQPHKCDSARHEKFYKKEGLRMKKMTSLTLTTISIISIIYYVFDANKLLSTWYFLPCLAVAPIASIGITLLGIKFKPFIAVTATGIMVFIMMTIIPTMPFAFVGYWLFSFLIAIGCEFLAYEKLSVSSIATDFILCVAASWLLCSQKYYIGVLIILLILYVLIITISFSISIKKSESDQPKIDIPVDAE